MNRVLYVACIVLALLLTGSGALVVFSQVDAADGLKSSLITFVIALGFALLGPALLAATVFFRKKGDSLVGGARGGRRVVPATPKPVHRPYLHGH